MPLPWLAFSPVASAGPGRYCVVRHSLVAEHPGLDRGRKEGGLLGVGASGKRDRVGASISRGLREAHRHQVPQVRRRPPPTLLGDPYHLAHPFRVPVQLHQRCERLSASALTPKRRATIGGGRRRRCLGHLSRQRGRHCCVRCGLGIQLVVPSSAWCS
eukprot:SAG11_NODE_2534_length_3245_cov_13.533058_3_plen_158_part_00